MYCAFYCRIQNESVSHYRAFIKCNCSLFFCGNQSEAVSHYSEFKKCTNRKQSFLIIANLKNVAITAKLTLRVSRYSEFKKAVFSHYSASIKCTKQKLFFYCGKTKAVLCAAKLTLRLFSIMSVQSFLIIGHS